MTTVQQNFCCLPLSGVYTVQRVAESDGSLSDLSWVCRLPTYCRVVLSGTDATTDRR